MAGGPLLDGIGFVRWKCGRLRFLRLSARNGSSTPPPLPDQRREARSGLSAIPPWREPVNACNRTINIVEELPPSTSEALRALHAANRIFRLKASLDGKHEYPADKADIAGYCVFH